MKIPFLPSLASLAGIKWKLLAGIAGISLLAVTAALIYARIDNVHLSRINHALDKRINDPESGLLVTVAQCRTNAETAIAGLETQNKAIQSQADTARKALADATARLAAAQAETRRAEKRVAILLSKPPVGATLEARVQDVDKRFLESLK